MTTVEGNVDHLGPAPMLGWARSPSDPNRRLRVRVALNDRSVGDAMADLYRPDLEAAGIGDGRHGFAFDLVSHFDTESEQRLRISCFHSDVEIWVGNTRDLMTRAAELRKLRRRPLWAIHQVQGGTSNLLVSGYLVPSAGEAPEPEWIADGVPVVEAQFPVESPPAPSRLWTVPGHRQLGFRLEIPLRSSELAPSTVIECIDRNSRRPIIEHGAFFVPDDLEEQLRRVPDGSRMERVQGHGRPDVHLLWGYTACRKIETFLEARFGRRLSSFPSILDWGCGCGRLSRHLAKVPGTRLTGVDIDADNIAWCRDNLTARPSESMGGDDWEPPRFETVPLLPPCDLPASSFDLILGHSVMTHLREEDQLAWLAELKRVSRPGAVLCLTVNADTAIWWCDPPLEVLRDWQARGFSDLARDPALDGLIGDEEYYRATFHREDYVRRVWGQYFEIIEILPGFAHIQDMVILRSR
ncbi:MAG: class I SAM-dependent methyltransferase [Thermoanaerobaculia bacterium]|nr:class I SAM-dependent methyltransferase [Thermoanaerobaculia bacterium]